MKNLFKLCAVTAVFTLGILSLSSAASACAPKCSTIEQKEKLGGFLSTFKDLAAKCDYDMEFVIKIERESPWNRRLSIFDQMKYLRGIVDNYHKGVCRHFTMKLERELSNNHIENYIIVNEGKQHCANLYINPINGQWLIADLTQEIGYKNNEGYDPDITLMGGIPLEQYVKLFWKNDYSGIKIMAVKEELKKENIATKIGEFQERRKRVIALIKLCEEARDRGIV